MKKKNLMREKVSDVCDYRNDSKISDRQAWANSAVPDQTAPLLLKEQSDQGLHCLLFCLHLLDSILVEPHCSNFRRIAANFRVLNIQEFYSSQNSKSTLKLISDITRHHRKQQ